MTRHRTTLRLALLLVCSCGHHEALEPIKATRHFVEPLLVPDLENLTNVVEVEILVPDGYEMQHFTNDVLFTRHLSDPEIEMMSLGTEGESGIGSTAPIFIHPDCHAGMKSGQAVRHESRSDGWVVVCRGIRSDDTAITQVVRDLRWGSDEFQCQVLFPDRHDIAGPSDHGRPSDARIADAIAICDSMTIRANTSDDKARARNGSAVEQP